MLLCRVDGNVVSTVHHPSLDGWRQVICQPVDETGKENDLPVVAVDPLGAGQHQRVIVSSDGLHTRTLVKDDKSPLRFTIISIIDE